MSGAFPAVVLVCPNRHGEVTTGEPMKYGPDSYCIRCGEPLTVSYRIIVVPGRRHSEMGCHE